MASSFPTESSSSSSFILPHPRHKSLRAGCRKEDITRRYLEEKILHISRRYTKKFQPAEDKRPDDVKGYVSMSEVAVDLDGLVDVVWLSGTPNLQTQYLLSIAGIINNFLPAFPPSPRATFSLLRKMDHVFSSLLKGQDIVTGEVLPGFSSGTKVGISKTDMVRLKSLVEETRVLVVNHHMDGKELENDSEVESSSLTYSTALYDMDIARVYELTVIQLGNIFESDGIFEINPTKTSQDKS